MRLPYGETLYRTAYEKGGVYFMMSKRLAEFSVQSATDVSLKITRERSSEGETFPDLSMPNSSWVSFSAYS